jgi:hypothetical protein
MPKDPYKEQILGMESRVSFLETTASNFLAPITVTIFHQSIINHTAMFTTTIKTTITDEDPVTTFPRTTKAIITIYSSSYVDNYISSYKDNVNKNLVSYYSIPEESTVLFYVGVINSTANIPPILIT